MGGIRQQTEFQLVKSANLFPMAFVRARRRLEPTGAFRSNPPLATRSKRPASGHCWLAFGLRAALVGVFACHAHWSALQLAPRRFERQPCIEAPFENFIFSLCALWSRTTSGPAALRTQPVDLTICSARPPPGPSSPIVLLHGSRVGVAGASAWRTGRRKGKWKFGGKVDGSALSLRARASSESVTRTKRKPSTYPSSLFQLGLRFSLVCLACWRF